MPPSFPEPACAQSRGHPPDQGSQGRDRRRQGRALYLYGSTVRDEATQASDIDLFIDPAPGFTFVQLIRLEDRLARICDAKVELTTRAGLHPTLRPAIEASAERVLCQARGGTGEIISPASLFRPVRLS